MSMVDVTEKPIMKAEGGSRWENHPFTGNGD